MTGTVGELMALKLLPTPFTVRADTFRHAAVQGPRSGLRLKREWAEAGPNHRPLLYGSSTDRPATAEVARSKHIMLFGLMFVSLAHLFKVVLWLNFWFDPENVRVTRSINVMNIGRRRRKFLKFDFVIPKLDLTDQPFFHILPSITYP